MLSNEQSPASDAPFPVVPNDVNTNSNHGGPSVSTPDSLPRAGLTPLVAPTAIPLTPVSTQTSEVSGRADAIQRGLISYGEAESLLSIYHAELAPACFIWPSGQTDLGTMRREHPVALLAALITAAPEKSPVRERLHREFRETVARKFVVDFNLKDVDLLRGIMLYAIWYVTATTDCEYAKDTVQVLCVSKLRYGSNVHLGPHGCDHVL